MSNPELKDAVWQVLEQAARHQESGGTVHSDYIIRKFPQVNEIELINAIGELVEDGKVTVKAATIDAHGNATAYHIHVRDAGDRPDAPPTRGPRIASGSVGFGPGSGPPPPEQKPPADEPKKSADRAVEQASRVSVGFGGDQPALSKQPPPDDRSDRVNVSVPGTVDKRSAMQMEAEQNFADEMASFFAELEMAETSDPDARDELTNQLMVLMAMFQMGETRDFTTPINKLAALKTRVAHVVPDLVGDYVLLVQTAVRAWLGRV
jgi:hypothetical protein